MQRDAPRGSETEQGSQLGCAHGCRWHVCMRGGPTARLLRSVLRELVTIISVSVVSSSSSISPRYPTLCTAPHYLIDGTMWRYIPDTRISRFLPLSGLKDT